MYAKIDRNKRLRNLHHQNNHLLRSGTPISLIISSNEFTIPRRCWRANHIMTYGFIPIP